MGDAGSTRRGPEAAPSRRVVVTVFALVLAAQPFQYWFIHRFGEPYPALTMPSFPSAVPAGEPIDVSGVEILADFDGAEPAAVAPLDLLAPLPLSLAFRVLVGTFSVEHSDETLAPAAAPGPASGLTAWLVDMLPGLALKRAHAAPGPVEPATRAWLAGRVRVLFPDRRAVAVRFRWFGDTYDLDTTPIRRTRTFAGECRVGLS